MSDARWIEVRADVAAAVRHFRSATALWQAGGFEDEGLDAYRAEMALMHALQSAHTSLESCLVRILAILGEERPVGFDWHADIIRRVSIPIAGKRPAIFGAAIAAAANETRKFRHRATHNYDSFEIQHVSSTIAAAQTLADKLLAEVEGFIRAVDPAP